MREDTFNTEIDVLPSTHDLRKPGGEKGKKNHKIRITIHLDGDVVAYFKNQSVQTTKRYQTLINDALREHIGLACQPRVITDLRDRVTRLEKALFRRTPE